MLRHPLCFTRHYGLFPYTTLFRSFFNMEMVIGTISNTVLTLSINIDIVAVKTQNITINLHIFPLDALLILTPRYSKTPVSPNIATIIIIPNRRPIVLKSMELIANSKLVDAVKSPARMPRSEEHTSELKSLMRISYAV